MRTAACPSDDALVAFLERRHGDAASIERHLDVCATCRTVIAHLAAMRTSAPAAGDVTMTARSTPQFDVRRDAPALREAVRKKGDRVGRYVVERELGRGGMGVVLEAFDTELHRRVALKLLRVDDSSSADPGARARFVREARAMAKLAHPNVVTVFDVGQDAAGDIFIAMELVDGASLRALLPQRRTVERTLDLFTQAAKGLAAAHALGLVHRDFKPDNVLVGRDGRVRVTDFGLVRASGEGLEDGPITLASGGPLTATGGVVGTPAYMAPEQHLGLAATAKADQFAFAASLYEGLTGTRLFGGRDYLAIRDLKLRGGPIVWPPSVDVDPMLRAAIDRALERDPDRRHPDMSALIAALDSANRQPQPAVVAAPTAPYHPPMGVPLRQLPVPVPSPPIPPPQASLGRRLGIAALIVLAIVAFEAVRLHQLRKEDSTPTLDEAAPPKPPSFEPIVKNATIDSTLRCPAGTRQQTFRETRMIQCWKENSSDKEGPSLRFHPNGALKSQSTIEHDKLVGLEWEFRPDGTLQSITSRTDGENDGVSYDFHSNGIVRNETTWSNGRKHGTERSWDERGKLVSWLKYENGTKVVAKYF